MPTQFIRNVSLIVAPRNGDTALDLSEMHFRFITKRGDLQTPNSLSIVIYNLSDATVQKLANAPTAEFSRVVLQVGYIGLIPDQPYLGTIFDGNIKYVRTGNDNSTDSYIEIVAADGDSAYNFAVVNVSLAAGSTASDHINACLIPMGQVQPQGVTAGSIPTYTTPLPRGKVMFGKARDYIRNIADTVQASWSIQDGQLQLVPVAGYLPDEAIELNSATGLIGFPQKTQSGIVVRSLINPKIKIGARIHLNNAAIQRYSYSLAFGAYTSASPANVQLLQALKTDADGYYRVLWVEHSGDTRGNQWYSDLICVAVDASYTNVTNPEAASDEVVYIPK